MSKCCSFFNTPNRGQVLQRTVPNERRCASACDEAEKNCCGGCNNNCSVSSVLTPNCSSNSSCSPCQPPEPQTCGAETAAVAPVPKCPSVLTAMVPAIYDECGINLCRVVTPASALPADTACVEAQVLDVDFNIGETEGTTFTCLASRPNCVRITLSNLAVTFRITALDCCGNILQQSVQTVTYLEPDSCSCTSDPDTNPTSITLDMYVPYGLTYSTAGCGAYCPTITFLGPVAGVNNQLEQGLSVQGVAKVIRFDACLNQMALGLTLYLRSIYFTQYKLSHQGLAIPPKAVPVEDDETDACQDFVDGALLAPQICPVNPLTCC